MVTFEVMIKMMIDTIIVPSKEDTFESVFMIENCWYPIRLGSEKIDVLKWIAVCQSIPIRALTHYARITTIEKYKETGRYVINFEQPIALVKPLSIREGSKFTVQGQRYTTLTKILRAKEFEDLKPWV